MIKSLFKKKKNVNNMFRFNSNEVEDDFEKESPEYGSPEKNPLEMDIQIIENDNFETEEKAKEL